MNKKALCILTSFAIAIGVFGLIWTPGALADNSEITAKGGSYSSLSGQDHQGVSFSAIPTALPGQRGLYAVDDNTNSFYKIDPYSGVTTFIGPCVEDLWFSGLAYDTSTGTMYVSDVTLGGIKWGLGTINLTTGEVTIIGSHVISLNITGLAYDSLNDVLYGSDWDSDSLVSIDRATGVATVISGTFIAATNISGLAYCPVNDTLYGIDDTNLYTIDRTTGEATVVGTHGITTGSYIGLEYDENTGRLYAACSGSPNLYFLNMVTGTATPLGPTGIQISGLASIPAVGYRSVLYVNNLGGLDSDFITGLQGMDIDGLSLVDARYITPSTAYMQDFSAVLVSAGGFFADPVTIGDNLADYVDAGGGVCLFVPTLYNILGTGLGGRIITPAYSPLPVVGGPGPASSSVSFESHPITSGVTSLSCNFPLMFTATQGAGQSLGVYDTGYLLGAYNADKPIAVINSYPRNGDWGGDFIQMTENAINWLAFKSEPPPPGGGGAGGCFIGTAASEFRR